MLYYNKRNEKQMDIDNNIEITDLPDQGQASTTEEPSRKEEKSIFSFFAFIPAVVSVAFVILTNTFTGPMVTTSQYTPYLIGLLALTVLFVILAKRPSKKDTKGMPNEVVEDELIESEQIDSKPEEIVPAEFDLSESDPVETEASYDQGPF